MRSFIEILFIDSADMAQKTDLEWQGATNAETWARFNDFREYAVDIKTARFLLDYHNARGDLADTIAVDDAGFTIITGQKPKAEADYHKIDSAYWRKARQAIERRPARKAA